MPGVDIMSYQRSRIITLPHPPATELSLQHVLETHTHTHTTTTH